MSEHERRFERNVLARLQRLARRLSVYVLLDGLAVLAISTLLAVTVQFLIDWSMRLRMDMRAALLIAILAVIAVIAWRRIVAPLRRRYGVFEAACLVEQRYPQLQSLLVSGLQFFLARRAPQRRTASAQGSAGASPSQSPELVAAVIDESAQCTANLPLGALLNHRRAARSGGMGVVVIVVFLAAWLIPATRDLASLWFQRNILLADVSWPQRTRLMVEANGNVITAARGDDLEIRAAAHGEVPRQVEILFDAGRKSGRETMIAVGERGFRYTFPHVAEELTFSLRGGDDRTREYSVRLVDRPHVDRSIVRIAPPPYTRMAPVDLPEGQRAAEALPGSEVAIRIETNKPVVKAVLRAGDQVIDAAQPADVASPLVGGAVSLAPGTRPDATGFSTHWSVSFRPAQTQSYQFDLLDDSGLEDKHPARFSVRIIKDEPPRARLKLTGVSDMVTAEAVLPVDLEFSDAYGLATAEFVYQFASRAASIAGTERDIAAPVPLSVPGFETRVKVFNARFEWPLSAAAAVPGDRITVFARAADADDVSGPNVGQSSGVTMRVVTRDELLADLGRREQEYRQSFERLIEAQEQVRGQLLTLIGHMSDAQSTNDFGRAISAQERRQRQIAGQVNIIRQQFEQILTEMRVNRLDTSIVQERLGRGVIEPLGWLARREMITAADLLRNLAGEPATDVAAGVDPLQAEIIQQMRAVLTQMVKWEGFQETVNMLREILRLQGELNAETEEAIRRQAEEIFK